MIPSLKYVPRKTLIQLFSEVFDQLTEILADIAPDGWENSAYYPLFHYSPEEDALLALLDKVTRTQYQQRFGVLKYQENAFDDFQSVVKKIVGTHEPEPCHPQHELCRLFVDALSSISNYGNFYLKDATHFYEVNPPVAHTAAEIVARDKGLFTEKPYSLPMMPWHKRILVLEANLIPLMRYLFKALPKTDFHWEYLDHEFFDFVDYCNTYKEGDDGDRVPYYANNEDHKLDITSTPSVDDYFKQSEKALPAEPVVAYADVFGDWPKGFPPTKDHYLALYKNLNDSNMG